MRLGRQKPEFVAPENYPQLTELQVGMLDKVSRQQLMIEVKYTQLWREHVTAVPAGMPLDEKGRRRALALAQYIAEHARMVSLFGPLFLPGLPPELSPARALVQAQRMAYSCIALIAPDALPETVVQHADMYTFSDSYDTHAFYRAVNSFPLVSDERIGQLLAEAAPTPTPPSAGGQDP